MKKIFLACLLAFSFLALACNCGGISVVNSSVSNPSRPVALITKLKSFNVTMFDKDSRVKGNCAGTVVHSSDKGTYVLTAYHCIDDKNAKPEPYGFVEFDGVGEKERYRVEPVKYNRLNDLALMKITDKMEGKIYARISPKNPVDGQEIWVIGYGARQRDILSKGIVAIADTYSIHTYSHCMLLDASIFYGNSGGGVFNNRGELLGVVVQIGPSYPIHGLWGYSIHAQEVRDFVNNYFKFRAK